MSEAGSIIGVIEQAQKYWAKWKESENNVASLAFYKIMQYLKKISLSIIYIF